MTQHTFNTILTLRETVAIEEPQYADLDWLRGQTGLELVDNADPRLQPARGDSLATVLMLSVEDLLDRSRPWRVTSIKLLATRDAPNDIAEDAVLCFQFTVSQE